jgi:hypothetical protein
MGWHPVTHMVRLLAKLLDAELVEMPVTKGLARRRQPLALAPRRRGRGACLVVAAEPRHLLLLLDQDYLLRGHDVVAGWVIDSFWTERMPRALLRRGHFDRLFVTDKELVELWQEEAGVATSWLPWGSDVLRLGSGAAERPVDLQRLGRQPAGWDDDEATRAACERLGLRFEGRPSVRDGASDNQRAVMEALGRAKFALAFSNAVSGADYTHPTHEYVTGRWTDSVASGATVAGIAPRVAAAEELLPDGTTLELGGTDLETGLERIEAAVASWSPERAAANHRFALERLDWRWRFLELAAALGLQSARLDEEIGALRAAAS